MENVIKQQLLQGQKLERKNRPNEAIAVYEKVLQQFPKQAEAALRISLLFIKYREFENAVKSLTYLLKITEDKHIAYMHLGTAKSNLGRPEEAIRDYYSAIVAKSDFPLPYHLLSHVLKRYGRGNELSPYVEESLQKHPDLGDLHCLMGKIEFKRGNYRQSDEHYQKAIELGMDPSVHLSAVYKGHAKVKEKLKLFDEAMALCIEGNRIAQREPGMRQLGTHDKVFNSALIKIDKTNTDNWPSETETSEKDPIFIIGFPRSGTTLVEQMLSTQQHLCVSDERQVLYRSIVNISDIVKRKVKYPFELDSINEDEIRLWRNYYFTEMKKYLPELEDSQRIVDKNPMSLAHLPAIKRIFPNSPIIMMIRDPRDTCLSCFFQAFQANLTTVNFLKLKTTFAYYAKSMETYLSLKEAYPLNILEIKYEDLCENVKQEAQKISQHIGLESCKDLLEFYDSRYSRNIHTPSSDAVLQPVSKQAIGNWQNYQKHLAPFIKIIAPYLVKFGYE